MDVHVRQASARSAARPPASLAPRWGSRARRRDKQITALGFGAIPPGSTDRKPSFCFPLNGDGAKPEVQGLQVPPRPPGPPRPPPSSP